MNSPSQQALFSAYLVLAVGYNLLSLVLMARIGKGAAPTDPVTGFLFVSVLYLVYSTGAQVSNWLYLFFLSCFTVLIFYFGVLNHLLKYDEDKYFSRLTWLCAFSINAFGVVVLIWIITTALAAV